MNPKVLAKLHRGIEKKLVQTDRDIERKHAASMKKEERMEKPKGKRRSA